MQKIKSKRTKRGNINSQWILLAEGYYEDDPDIYLKSGQTWENNNGVKVQFPEDNNTYIVNPIGYTFEIADKKYLYDSLNNEVRSY